MSRFWKYEKKIGMLRKKYIKEDRQRLLDQIERFTPTYKAVIKNQGQVSWLDLLRCTNINIDVNFRSTLGTWFVYSLNMMKIQIQTYLQCRAHNSYDPILCIQYT